MASDAEGGAKPSRRLSAIAVRAGLGVGRKARSEAEGRSLTVIARSPAARRATKQSGSHLLRPRQPAGLLRPLRGLAMTTRRESARGTEGHGTPARSRGPACLTTKTQATTETTKKQTTMEHQEALIRRWEDSTRGARAPQMLIANAVVVGLARRASFFVLIRRWEDSLRSLVVGKTARTACAPHRNFFALIRR